MQKLAFTITILLSLAEEYRQMQVVPRGTSFIINIYDKNLKEHICIGTYIKSYFVLTSAVCAIKAQTYNEVLLIASDLVSNINGQSRKPVSYVIHPKYDPDNKINNIALIEIFRPFSLGADVDMIRIPKHRKVWNRCSLIGWTFWNNDDGVQRYLVAMSVKARALTPNDCEELQRDTAIQGKYLQNAMLCVWDALCLNEEGAPLVCDGLLFGILSYTACTFTVIESTVYHDSWITKATMTVSKRRSPVDIDDDYSDEYDSSKAGKRFALSYAVLTPLVLFSKCKEFFGVC